jgi:hypothetical protein
MTPHSTSKSLGRAILRLAFCLIIIPEAVGADPELLPPPRAETALRKLVLPDALPEKPPPATTTPPGSQAEVPKPEGRPGRATPDTAGGGKAKHADKDTKRDVVPPDGRCDRCGGCDCVRKVCVPRMTEKEIKKVCWDSKCEDFCVPGRSVWCGTVGKKDECGCWTHGLWKPSCAEVRTRVVPVRKETKRKVPAVEWSVEERCACCRRQGCDLPPSPPSPEAAGNEAEKQGSTPRKN